MKITQKDTKRGLDYVMNMFEGGDGKPNITHCRKGLHLWTDENIGICKNGDKYCRKCKKEYSKNYKRKILERYIRICPICEIEEKVLKVNLNKICHKCSSKKAGSNKIGTKVYKPINQYSEEIINMYKADIILREISEKFKINATVIYRILKENNIPRRDNTEIVLRANRKTHSGPNNNWKGGKTTESINIRKSIEYKKWRNNVFKRDHYICQFCKNIGGKLNADHIKPFCLFPDLIFDINNGRTLCVECHKKTPTYLKNRGYLRKLFKINEDNN